MTDSPCGFTKDQLLATLAKYGPLLSAHEIARLAYVSVWQVLCVTHCDSGAWWDIEQVAGERGWLYRARQSLPKSAVKPVERMREYDNSGISMRTVNYG